MSTMSTLLDGEKSDAGGLFKLMQVDLHDYSICSVVGNKYRYAAIRNVDHLKQTNWHSNCATNYLLFASKHRSSNNVDLPMPVCQPPYRPFKLRPCSPVIARILRNHVCQRKTLILTLFIRHIRRRGHMATVMIASCIILQLCPLIISKSWFRVKPVFSRHMS